MIVTPSASDRQTKKHFAHRVDLLVYEVGNQFRLVLFR